MRKFFLTALVLSAMLVLATSGLALERTTALLTDDSRADGWNAGSTTCSVAYYNTCTGWVWVWSGWGLGDQLGVCFDSCCPPGSQATLATSWNYVWTSAPSGYGFTGTIDVFAADQQCCPSGAPIASQPFLGVSGWNGFAWGVPVPSKFIVAISLPGATNNPVAFPTEHSAAGPTGPAACGTCWPTTRVTHSFYWGRPPAQPLCPGSPFFDGVCGNELLADAALVCGTISVEESSWGSIKGLYR